MSLPFPGSKIRRDMYNSKKCCCVVQSNIEIYFCLTQLKLYTVDRQSSSIFCCLSVCLSGIGVTRPNLHFFQYIQAYMPFADHVPPNIKQYQLILTKYQPVPSYTDPVPSSTTYNSSFDESRTVYLV